MLIHETYGNVRYVLHTWNGKKIRDMDLNQI